MNDFFRKINHYGYELDVFDKYRDAVARYNRSALGVLSLGGILTAVGSIVGVLASNHSDGLTWGLVMLAVSIACAVLSRQKEMRKEIIQIAGYVLCASFYCLAIYGNVTAGREAYWVGVNMAMGCYLLDYFYRLFALQGASFILLMIMVDTRGGGLTGDRLLVSAVFLAAGAITVYALGKARIGLIVNREISKLQADTDLLTGLMNRTAAEEEINATLSAGEETDVLMLLDLDHFKSVNDRLGHQMGDKVLVDVSADLKKMFRNTDVLSRLGGDEFIIYMHAVPEREWAKQRAEQVARVVRRWVTDGNTNIQITASIGVVMTTDGLDREYGALYRAADVAMYFAKEQGGNKAVFYSRELLNQSHGVERKSAADDLR